MNADRTRHRELALEYGFGMVDKLLADGRDLASTIAVVLEDADGITAGFGSRESAIEQLGVSLPVPPHGALVLLVVANELRIAYVIGGLPMARGGVS